MALTATDLQSIRGVVREVVHEDVPEIVTRIVKPIVDKAIGEVLEVMNEGFTMVSEKFEEVDGRLDHLEQDMRVRKTVG